jgi:hypothetical protein
MKRLRTPGLNEAKLREFNSRLDQSSRNPQCKLVRDTCRHKADQIGAVPEIQ